MFERILVPLDGSSRAESAIPIAARLARAAQGHLIFVRVVNHFILGTAPWISSGPIESEDVVSREDAEAYLKHVASSSSLASLPVETRVLSGPIASTLLLAAVAEHVDLLVLCSHGQSGVTRRVLGSVAEKLVCRSTIPLFLLRNNELLTAGLPVEDHQAIRVLVPLTGTPTATLALEPAAALAAALSLPQDGSMHVLRTVLPSHEREPQGVCEGDIESVEVARHSLNTITSYLYAGVLAPAVAHYHVAVTSSVVESENLVEALVREAESEGSAEGDISSGCDVIALSIAVREDRQRLAPDDLAARIMAVTRRPLLFVYASDRVHKNMPCQNGK